MSLELIQIQTESLQTESLQTVSTTRCSPPVLVPVLQDLVLITEAVRTIINTTNPIKSNDILIIVTILETILK